MLVPAFELTFVTWWIGVLERANNFVIGSLLFVLQISRETLLVSASLFD